MPVEIRRENQILERMVASTVARSRLSDISTTSEVLGMLRAVARELDEIYFQLSETQRVFDLDQAEGGDLDERAAVIQPHRLVRKQGTRASGGGIIFSRISNIGSVTLAPGIVVQTADGRQYRTTEGTQVDADSPERVPGHGIGVDFAPVAVIAQELGPAGNASAGEIVAFGQRPIGIASVTNSTALVNGRATESDQAFRTRIKQFISSLARVTPAALESAALGLEDPATGATVVSAQLAEEPSRRGEAILYIDDGSGATSSAPVTVTGEVLTAEALGGEEFLRLLQGPVVSGSLRLTSSTRGVLDEDTYALNPVSRYIRFNPQLAPAEQITATYQHYTGLIAHVQAHIEDYRGQGVLVRVLAPTARAVAWDITLTTEPGVSRETLQKFRVPEVVSEYVSSLPIGQDVVVAEAIERIMALTGVYDVSINIPETTRVSIASSERAVTTTAQVVVR